MYPHIYHVSLTRRLWDLKQELIISARVQPDSGATTHNHINNEMN
jgi:hypothetical protein